jgi:hypothetical protein
MERADLSGIKAVLDYLVRGVKDAVRAARVHKHVSCHTLRHFFATHLLESGYDIRTVRSFWGRGAEEALIAPEGAPRQREKELRREIDRKLGESEVQPR